MCAGVCVRVDVADGLSGREAASSDRESGPGTAATQQPPGESRCVTAEQYTYCTSARPDTLPSPWGQRCSPLARLCWQQAIDGIFLLWVCNVLLSAAILTQLHWSLPRPLSDAELQFSADLEVAGSRQQALEQTWRHLSARSTAVLNKPSEPRHSEHSRPQTPQSAGRGAASGAGSWWKQLGGINFGRTPSRVVTSGARAAGSRAQQSVVRVPQAQLEPVHNVLREHMAAIGRYMAEVERMQELVQARQQEHQCKEAVAQLRV